MLDSSVQQIKEKLDIVEVVSSYIKLEKIGINWRAPCPFHSEKKPSFFVSPTRQMFKCFGCSEGGSVFDFVMKIEGVEFGDALRILARRAGVELKTFRPELQTKRQRLFEICELGCCFFEKQLAASSMGKLAKDYLLQRGLTEESIKKWRLGYSPQTWRSLSDFLVSKGYKREELLEAGLAVKSEKAQTPYDIFRGRIMFPIFDLNSQVIGFGARVFQEQKDEQMAKYINTPNTILYDKSRILYGLNFGKVEVRKKDFCILAEGYMDVILSHQAGFQNTAASSGTALTPYQLKILKRYTSNLLTAFDMDAAGGLATIRGIDSAQKEDFEVKVICMPSDTDPADIISSDPEKWKNLVGEAKEIMSFYFENTCSKFDKESPKGKKEICRTLLPAIKKIPNKILQSHWVQKLAQILRVSEEAIFEELRKLTPKSNLVWGLTKREKELEEKPSSFQEEKETKTRKELLEERIVSLALCSPQDIETIKKEELQLFSPKMKAILATLLKEFPFEKENITHGGEFQKDFSKEKSISRSDWKLPYGVNEIFNNLEKEDKELKKILLDLSFRAEISEEKEPGAEIQLCLAQLEKVIRKDQLYKISKEIRVAEEEGNKKKVENLIQKFNELAQVNK